MVKKIQNYHAALTHYINATLGLPFEWGKRDCVTYAIGALEAMIGRQTVKPDFHYENRQEALDFAKNWSLEAGMQEQLNAYEVPQHFQQPGDILIANDESIKRVYVVFDRRAYSPVPGDTVRAFNIHALYEAFSGWTVLRFD